MTSVYYIFLNEEDENKKSYLKFASINGSAYLCEISFLTIKQKKQSS